MAGPRKGILIRNERKRDPNRVSFTGVEEDVASEILRFQRQMTSSVSPDGHDRVQQVQQEPPSQPAFKPIIIEDYRGEEAEPPQQVVNARMAVLANAANPDLEAGMSVNQDDQEPAEVEGFTVVRRRGAGEQDSLLGRERTSGILRTVGRGFANFGRNTAKNVYNGAFWVKDHPLLFLIAVVTALPNALFAFTSDPEKIKETISRMSKTQIAFASAKAASSWLINAIMNAYFLTTASKKVRTIVSHMGDGPKQFAEGISVLLLALGAAIGAGAIGYNAFLWMPMAPILAAAPGAIYLSVNFASRIIGVHSAFTTVRNLTSADAKVQRELEDKLKHINVDNPDHKKLFEDHFRWIKSTVLRGKANDYQLTDADFEKIYVYLARMISLYNETERDFLLDTSNTEVALKYFQLTLRIFYVSSALVFCALPYGMTYLEKGRDGMHILMNLIGKLFGLNWGLDNLPRSAQIAIGLPSGIATFLLASMSLIDTPSTTSKIFHQLRQNPQDIITTGALLGANALSSGGPYGVAKNLVDNDHNLFGLRPGSVGTAFEILNAVAGGDVNARYSLAKAMLTDQVTVQDLTYIDVLSRLQDTNNHLICRDTTESIRSIGLFAQHPAPRREHENHDLNRIISAPGMV